MACGQAGTILERVCFCLRLEKFEGDPPTRDPGKSFDDPGGTRPQEIVREMAAEGVVLAVRFAESVTRSHQFLHARLQPENHLTFIPSLSRLQEPGYGFPKGVEDPSFWKFRLHFLCLLSYYYLGRLLLTRTLASNPRSASSTTNTIGIRCRFSEG